jgi:hypothetical protein
LLGAWVRLWPLRCTIIPAFLPNEHSCQFIMTNRSCIALR